jgi:hypothetical protein
MAQAHSSPSTRTFFGQVRSLWLLAASAALALLAVALLAAGASAQTAEPPNSASLNFVQNGGQTDAAVRYLARGSGYSFLFADDKAVLSFAKPAGGGDARSVFAPGLGDITFADDRAAADGLALGVRFVGANPDARIVVDRRARGAVNDLTGPAGERQTDMPAHERLTYRELWPGIDLVFRGEGGKLKYEFHLEPGADPRDIQIAYTGANGLSLNADGSLAIHTAMGRLHDAAPVSYQRIGGATVPVDSAYAVQDGGHGYGFAVESGYDRARPLVIDPALDYSKFLGGTGSDSGRGIAVDEDGNSYVTGQTASADYPTTPGVYDAGYNNNVDAFVTKLDPSGSQIVYSTFIGGTAFDSGNAIAIDDQGGAYIGGFTGSTNYPTTPGAFDPTQNGGSDAFVSKLSPSGSTLEYSTYLGAGGFSFDGANGIAVDGDGSAYVTGFAGGGTFPTTVGAYDRTHNGRNDVYVTKLTPSGSALAYSTFVGGALSDTGNAIAVDDTGSAYVTGFTASADYPTTPGAFDAGHNGGNDGFAVKVDPSGSALTYSTFLGGAGNDSGTGIAVDDKRRTAHVTGSTDSADYPTTRHAYDRSYDGGGDVFVSRLEGSGSGLVYSTFLGGTGRDSATGIAVDEKGQAAHVTGSTDSGDYPTTRHADGPSYNGGGDAFVTRLDDSGSKVVFSTFLGGAGIDAGNALAVDEKGKAVYVTGSTSRNGGDDVFVTKLRTKGGGDEGHDSQGDGDD